MKKNSTICKFVLLFSLLVPFHAFSQKDTKVTDRNSHILTSAQLEKLLVKPLCLEGYRSNQSGPLSRIDKKPGEKDDSTFTVEKMKILSKGLLINGWLYLPKETGEFPLVILTNGGGDGSSSIKSLSDWIAPIFAHCGIAADSKALPLAITIKFFRSLLLNLDDPSAMLSIMLKEARRSWSLVVRSNFLEEINLVIRIQNAFAF